MKLQPVQESRWVGRVLRDKWRIDARIARGGMGTVFAATHRNNGSTAAIKILHPQFCRDSDTRSRFLQEGYAANKVNHPGVVRILDDDVTEEGLAYLVMELLEGELLEQRRIRKGGRLPLVEVYEFAEQLLDVLAAAHEKGIVHRDIKPDNIFLTRQGRLKVLDFGFAQMLSGFRTEQTATGFLLGTPGFMAPEQATGNRPLIDAQTDLWSVGATLFLLLTGQPVHAGESAAEMLVAAANFPVRSISTLEPALPTKLRDIVDRALAFKKSERWPDARSMQTALRSVPGRQKQDAPEAMWRGSIPDDERRPAIPPAGPIKEPSIMELIEELEPEEILDGDGIAPLAVGGMSPVAPGGPETRRVGGFSAHPLETTIVMAGRPDPQRAAASVRPQPSRRPPELPPHPQPSEHPERRAVPSFAPAPRPPMHSYAPDPHPRSLPSSPAGANAGANAHANERMFEARPPHRHATPTGPRWFVLVLVAGVSMVVVILTGLLVILGTE